MPLRWLAEDEKHPVRPDLPVLRHLTFTEVHAIELGVYIGLLAFFAVRIGRTGEIMTLLIGIVRFTMSDGRAKSGATKVTHRIGFHDVRKEPQYFGAGFLFVFGPAMVGVRVWSAFGLGTFV
jgi:hypothetical protein